MVGLFLLFRIFQTVVVLAHAEECKESSLHYQSSPCDGNGRKWVFKVPISGSNCTLTNASIPRLIENCQKPCPGGTHLEIERQECIPCLPGTFSRGDTVEYTKWNDIPKEFVADKSYGVGNVNNCSTSSWEAKGDYLQGKALIDCAIILSMHLNNHQSGQILFTYSIADYNTMAFFTIRNAHCSQTPGNSFLLQHTGQYVFLNVTTRIPKGDSVLQWYLFTENNVFRSIFGAPESIIKISYIRITGTPPVLRCTDCPAGTFSKSLEASVCETCPENTYSTPGSYECKQCGPNEYSERGSSQCQVKLPCEEKDYMHIWSNCDAQGQRVKQWKWIEPKICDEHTGVALPEPDTPVPCEPCPLGTMLTKANRCEPCPTNSTMAESEIRNTCIACDKDHVPAYGLNYSTWSYFPTNVETTCQSAFGYPSCQKWVLDKNFIRSGVGLYPNAVSSLKMYLPNGFVRSDEIFVDSWPEITLIPPVPDTYLAVNFEIKCEHYCELQLRQEQVGREEFMVRSWTGSVPRQDFIRYIKDSRPTNFTWTFQKMNPNHNVFDHDHVRIYSIRVTNAMGLGAIGCRKCLKGMKNGKCITCPRGLFYVEVTNQSSHQTLINCTECPTNHVVISDSTMTRSVSEACIPCEPGTRSINSSLCVLDTAPITPNGIQYNLTEFLSAEHRINGTRMFTPSGNRYVHEFRLQLSYGKTTECVEEFSSSFNTKVTALICRHTCVWTSTQPEKTVYTKPISLADRMVKAIPSNISQSFWDEINRNLTRAGWTPDTTGNDLHYIFETDDMTKSCPHGRKAVVTLRCGFVYDYSLDDPDTAGILEVPPSCPDGTCDGCLYQFLWTGLQACPICRSEELQKIVGECHYGKRTVYRTAPRGCRLSGSTLQAELESCPVVTKGQMAVIILTVIIMCLLSFIILICHRRNKRLQYKYMKLIQSAESKSQQPNSCALEEVEEETVDTFSRRAIRPDGSENLGMELEPTVLASISPFSKVQFPRVGPIVFKSKADSDTQYLPENEMTS